MVHIGYEVAAPDVIAESLEGEVLIVNLATGVYFRGGSAAAAAWAAVTSGSITPTDESASQGIEAFVAELLAEGLIRPRAATAPPVKASSAILLGPFELEKFEDLQDMLALDPIHDVDPNTGWPRPQ